MKNSEILTISGRDIEVREMSAKEIDDYINGRLKTTLVPEVDVLMGSHIPADIILHCTGMTKEELLESYPSDIDKIIKKIEEMNPFFARLAKLALAQPEVRQ